MKSVTRRALLAGASLSALALAGCASLTASQVQQDVAAIAAGISGIATAAAGLVPPDVLAKIQSIVSSIEAQAALIGQALTPSASLLQQISAGISALSAILAPFFPVAPGIAAVVQAAIALLGVVLQATGVTAPAPAPTQATIAMTPDAARAILKSAATSGIKVR